MTGVDIESPIFQLESVGVKATAQVLEPVVTTWQPFFHDLAHKLLEYEDRQPELVQLLRDAGVSVQNDEGEPLTVLDPFSFFSLILNF